MNVRPGQKARVVLPMNLCQWGQSNDGIVVMVDRLLAPGEELQCQIDNPGPAWHVTSISRPFRKFLIGHFLGYRIYAPAGETWETTVPDKLLKPLPDDEQDLEVKRKEEELT